MASRKEGYSQAAAAARSGFSERSGRRLGVDPVLPSQRDRTRRYRTRQDPFAEVWREELVPLLQAMPSLRATTLLEELQRHHPGGYPDQLLRSLQRRVAHWRATEGPERELIFRQEHPPGLQALSDFTDGGGLGVTLDGEPFAHLLYHFWLAYSGWQYVKAICGGESFTALTEGLQEALWQLGGVPRTHRTDRLSAAYRNLTSQDDEAARYAEFCRHYGMDPTRNNAGVSHENGSVEASHGHLKTGLEEALELRGSRDFPDLAAYQALLQEFIARKNARRREAVAVELAALQPFVERLPCMAKDRAREQLVTEHRAAEGLRLLDQGADQMMVVDDALGWSIALVVAPRHAQHRRRPEMADQPIIVDLHLQAAADQARGHGVEDVAHRDRA